MWEEFLLEVFSYFPEWDFLSFMKNTKESFFKEFIVFIKEYKVASLAVAFVIGQASTALINSFVKDILLPFAAPLMSAETWREAVITIGPVTISYGSFLAELINFIILALIIFIVVKKVIKIEKEETK